MWPFSRSWKRFVAQKIREAQLKTVEAREEFDRQEAVAIAAFRGCGVAGLGTFSDRIVSSVRWTLLAWLTAGEATRAEVAAVQAEVERRGMV